MTSHIWELKGIVLFILSGNGGWDRKGYTDWVNTIGTRVNRYGVLSIIWPWGGGVSLNQKNTISACPW